MRLIPRPLYRLIDPPRAVSSADARPMRFLALVMWLPLLDGVFAALVVSNSLTTPAEIIQTGVLIFGGSATVAVILTNPASRRTQLRALAGIAVPLLAVAAIEAMLAPLLQHGLHLPTFTRFAAVIIATIAAQTVSAHVATYFPQPSTVLVLGIIGSLTPSDLLASPLPALDVAAASTRALYGVAAAGTGVVFAAVVIVASPWLCRHVQLDRFRFGSGVALGVLAVSVVTATPPLAPLAVLVVSAVLAFDPDGEVPRSEYQVNAALSEYVRESSD